MASVVWPAWMTPIDAVAENLAQLLAFFIQSRLSLRKSSFVVPPTKYPCAVTAQLCSTEFLAMVLSSRLFFRFAMISPSKFDSLYKNERDSSEVNPPMRMRCALEKCCNAAGDRTLGSTSTPLSFAAAVGDDATPASSISTFSSPSAVEPSTTVAPAVAASPCLGRRDATPATKLRSPVSTMSKHSCRPSSAESSASSPLSPEPSTSCTIISPTASASPSS
mmetsp:Transcript_27199/g.57746  ORF Transcript_27199/g.57746 Transcript_27199/m.57746 type:complete len:221 (-) Transcript_27199:1031-1693(-)